MYMVYGNGSGFEKILNDLENETCLHSKRYNSIYEIFNNLVCESNNAFSINDLNIKVHGFDNRINKIVYMITIKRYFKEDFISEYGCPQFYKYMIDLDEEVFLL